jgi:aspartate kinase
MIVMKFGGSSVADAAAVDRVATIVEGRLERRPLVVVSALGGTTDVLVSILERLEAGSAREARDRAGSVRAHHEQVIEAVVAAGPHRDAAMEVLEAGMGRLGRLMEGMDCLGEVSSRSRDAVLSLGELVSAPVLAAALASRDLPARAVDPRQVIVTDGAHEAAVPALAECTSRCRDVLAPMLEEGRVPVLGGYVGSSADGITTTLGRGGSDLTASLVARALGAEALEYWKDVDGILNADPGVVPEARPVARLSFQEAAELAFLGARVLHPASIQPAVDAGVPVHVLNSHRAAGPGTIITSELHGGRAEGPGQAVVSIACKRDQLLVNLYSTRMLGASGFLSRVFEVFERLGLSVDHIATSEVNVSVTLGQTRRVDELASLLGEVAEVRMEGGMGVVSVVGDRLSDTPGVAARLFTALGDINVHLITYGGSGVNLSFVVENDAVPDAVRRLHRALFQEGDGA